jgi:hypothetical protein
MPIPGLEAREETQKLKLRLKFYVSEPGGFFVVCFVFLNYFLPVVLFVLSL